MLYNILAIGDVVGGCGVSCLERHLRAVKKLKNIHFTVVNGENAAMVGRFHMFGVLVIPFVMVGMAFGKKGYKGILPYLTFAGVSTCLTMFVLSNFVGAEVTSMGTGLISILLSVAYVKLVGVKTPDEFRNESANHQRKYSSFKAMSPYVYMLVLLPLIRYGFPAVVENGFAIMCTFGYIFWVDLVILVCGILGALTLGVDFKTYKAVCKRTASGVCLLYTSPSPRD